MNRIISYTFFLLSVMTGGFAKIYANVKAPEESIAPTTDFTPIIIIVLQVLALFVVVGGFLYIKTYIRRKGGKMQSEVKEMVKTAISQASDKTKPDNNDLGRELQEANNLNNKLEQEKADLREQISALSSKNHSLKCELEEMRKFNSYSESNVVAAQKESEKVSNKQVDECFDRTDLDRFYIETPSEEKSIHQSKLSKEFVARDHSYEVVIDRSKPNHAKFRIFKDANFKRMIEQPNRFITPACEYGDASFESDKNIEMIEAGILELNGEEWKLVEKARVKIV